MGYCWSKGVLTPNFTVHQTARSSRLVTVDVIWREYMTERKPKPSTGIKIMGLIFLLIGIQGIYFLWFAGTTAINMIGCRSIPFYTHIYVCIIPFLKSLFLILPIGILRLNNWIRILTIILCLGLLLTNINQIASLPSMFEYVDFKREVYLFVMLLIETICFLSILYFFSRRSVRVQFINKTI